jgi:predicted helicase
MRQSLMNSFNQIYILDLHGNKKKKERCPDGSEDKNVFEIQQGVAILLAIKKPGLKRKVSHADCWGLRELKYEWLKANDVETTKWTMLTPRSDFYFFVPRDEKLLTFYQKYTKVTDIFPTNSVGVVTSRDEFVIDANKAEVEKRIRMFRDENLPDGTIKQAFDLKDTGAWKIKEARKKIREQSNWEKQIIPILYRPFDQRWIFYHDAVIERIRKDVMRHMMQENLALCIGRAGQVVGLEKPWNVVFCTETITDLNLFYRGGNANFPLYLYPDEDLYNNNKTKTYQREVNIDKQLFEQLQKAYRVEPTPEQILYYIYAVLYSNIYRQRFAEFLKSDFPRILFSADYKVFSKLARLGENLVGLHLMKSDTLDKPVAKFEGKGNNLVEKIRHDQKSSLVYINAGQYFGPVSDEIWEYQIGGYQVMDKWLSHRKGRRLALAEIRHYCRIATGIVETIAIQNKIDKIYPEIEQNVLLLQ